ncbi:MAG: DUF835 domain-containing protein, partial [Candidatus Altiarchaeota archaeon]|nr:DUF835 domain-containing protein [Candidatus Altiarchaeota archaeon]
EIPRGAVEGSILEISGMIYNPGDQTIKDVKIDLNEPEQFKVNKAPEPIKEILSKKCQRITIELIPTAVGEFTFKPLDISYVDSNNRTFTKGTNEVKVNVSAKVEAKAAAIEETAEFSEDTNVVVELENPLDSFAGQSMTLNGKITNKGKEPVYGVRFIGNPVTEFNISNTPEEMPQLDPSESKALSLEIVPAEPGEFNFKPLEIYYRSKQGRGRFAASNAVSFKVKEKAAPTVTEEPALEPGFTYLILEEWPEKSIHFFLHYISDGMKGIYITRTNPEKLKEKYDTKDARILWVTDAVSGKENVISSNLQDISLLITDFTTKNPNSVLVLDIIEYLIENNDFQMVLHFIQHVRDKISTTNCRMIISLNDKVLKEQNLNAIKKEAKVI